VFSHITVGSSDIDRSAKFYDAVFAPLGFVTRPVTPDGGPAARCWIMPGQSLPRFYVYMPFDRHPASVGNGSMVAFLAETNSAVDAGYAAGIAAGGRDAGAPGQRAHYGDGYCGAYLRDPDGNKVHLVCRGDILRTANISPRHDGDHHRRPTAALFESGFPGRGAQGRGQRPRHDRFDAGTRTECSTNARTAAR
jgi:catechol 2,3-dioxygenase-like lactoylglutathione lyase family enzyme